MSANPQDAQLRFGFYTDTYMYRSEVFFYRQAIGMQNSSVHVLARQGALLNEFPVDRLFLADEYRNAGSRLILAARRRMDRSASNKFRHKRYVVDRLARYLNRHDIDLVYCIFGWHASQLLDVIDRLHRPIPLVFSVGGTDINSPHLIGNGYSDRLTEALNRSTHVLCVSEFLRQKVLALGIEPTKVSLLYRGVDIPDRPQKSFARPHNQLRILAVSRIVDWKGLPHTLRAFEAVSRTVAGATLDIIGDGAQLGECRQLAIELGIDERVNFRGSQSIRVVYEAMRNADIFVTHSIRNSQGQEEGLGNSILEAMAHGLPIVGTRSGGIPESVVDGECGYLVDPGDEDGMAQAIVKLAENPELRRRLGANARERAMIHFNIDTQNEKLEAILTQVALEHRGAHA